MVVTDTVEGTIANSLWFHYDVGNDVLYLKLIAHRRTPCLGEETPDGLVLLRSETDDRPIGMTVVNWWKRFGKGAFPDSLQQVGSLMESWAEEHQFAV